MDRKVGGMVVMFFTLNYHITCQVLSNRAFIYCVFTNIFFSCNLWMVSFLKEVYAKTN